MSEKFIRTEGTRVVFTHYMPFHPRYGMGMSREELLQEGYIVGEIPEAEKQEGKYPEPHYTPEKGYYYEYVDLPEQKKADEQQEVENA